MTQNEYDNPAWIRLHSARVAQINAEATIDIELKREREKRIKVFEDQVIQAFREARDANLTKAATGRAYGSKDHKTIAKYWELAEGVESVNASIEALAPKEWILWGFNLDIAAWSVGKPDSHEEWSLYIQDDKAELLEITSNTAYKTNRGTFPQSALFLIEEAKKRGTQDEDGVWGEW